MVGRRKAAECSERIWKKVVIGRFKLFRIMVVDDFPEGVLIKALTNINMDLGNVADGRITESA